MSLENLPKEWVEAKLGDVVDYGKTEKAEPSELLDNVWVLELEDIEKDTSRIVNYSNFSERKSKSTKNKFIKGDVLYGKLRPYLNKVLIAEKDGVCTTEIVPIKTGKNIINKYLFYWLKHPFFINYVTEVGYGVNMPRLGTQDGINAPFILAPLAEQKEIVAQLDNLLAQVDTIKSRLDKIPDVIKKFRQSVLSAAVTGKLTEEWRKGKSECFHSKIWNEATINDLCHKITDGEHITPLLENDGVPLLSAKDVLENHLDFSQTKFVSEEFAKKSRQRCNPELNDILVVSRGATIGRTSRIRVEKNFCLMGSVLLFKPNNIVLPNFLEYFFKSPICQNIFAKTSGTTAQQAIYIRDVKDIKLDLPNIEEQHEIVRRVEELFAFADQIEARLSAAKKNIDQMTQSILAKAFRSDLTAKWRAENQHLITGENSARALLERIRGEKNTKKR